MAEVLGKVQVAVKERKDYIIKNLSTLTMKQFRGLLEEDLDMPPKSLKDYRDDIDQLVDKIVVEYQRKQNKSVKQEEEDLQDAEVGVLKPHNGQGFKSPNRAKKEKKVVKRKAKDSSSKENDSGKKRQRNRDDNEKAEKGGTKSKSVDAKPVTNGGGKQYSKGLLKMKEVCKKAGINIPTVIYKKKSDADIADGIAALLERHGLSKNSGRAEIADTRARIQKEKDLEGIDTSNILEGGRRSRNKIDYSQACRGPALGSDDSDSDEGDEQEGQDSEGSDSEGGSDVEASAKPKSKKKRKMSKQAQEEGEAEEMAQDSDAQEPSNEASDEDEPSAGVANQDGANSPCLGKQKEAGQNSESEAKEDTQEAASGEEEAEQKLGDSDVDVGHAKSTRKMEDWSDDE